MFTTGVASQHIKQCRLQSKVHRRRKLSMQQVSAYPKSNVKLIQEQVHCHDAALNEFFDASIAGKCRIVVESDECKHEATECVSRWIDCDLLKEGPIFPNRSRDTTISNIQFKGASSMTRY